MLSEALHSPQTLTRLVNKGLLVFDDIGVLDGGENPDLVEGIFLLFLRQIKELDSFESVVGVVSETLYLVHAAVSSVT